MDLIIECDESLRDDSRTSANIGGTLDLVLYTGQGGK